MDRPDSDSLGSPSLEIDQLRIWVRGREFPSSQNFRDGNWINIIAHCSAAGADVRVTYAVRADDTLTQVAKLFQVSVKEILSWNGIGSRAGIAPGQKLTIRMNTRRRRMYERRRAAL